MCYVNKVVDYKSEEKKQGARGDITEKFGQADDMGTRGGKHFYFSFHVFRFTAIFRPPFMICLEHGEIP